MAAYRVAVAEHNVKPYTNHPINSTNKNEQRNKTTNDKAIYNKNTHTTRRFSLGFLEKNVILFIFCAIVYMTFNELSSRLDGFAF